MSTMIGMRRCVAILTVVSLFVASCGSSDDSSSAAAELSISDAWSRQPADGQTVGVIYGVVSNPGDSDVRVVSVTTSVTDDAQLHETLMDDNGAMSMREVDGFVVPAGGDFTFEPGGPHMMLLGIDPTSFPADNVDAVLTFDDGQSISFDAEVRSIGGESDGMDDMDMDEMDSADGGDDEMEMEDG